MDETIKDIKYTATINPDSLEIGTPSKGGAIKVYFDSSNPDDAKKRIDAAIELRKYAAVQIDLGTK